MNNKIATLTFCFIMFAFTSQVIAKPIIAFVSIPPQKWLIEKLSGDAIDVHVLVDKGQEPHTFEPTPRQIVSLSAASVYFTLDMNFEKMILDKLVRNNKNLQIIDTTAEVNKIPLSEHGVHHDENHDDAHGAHDEAYDPHVWLSPINLKIMAQSISETLVTIDSKNKSIYQGKLSRLLNELDALHIEITTQLAPYEGSRIFVFHPSFGYFTDAYHLIQEAVEIEGKSPSPKQLSILIGKAKKDKVKVIFTQPQFDPKSSQAIANAIQGEAVPLDPLAENVAENIKTMADKVTKALTK